MRQISKNSLISESLENVSSDLFINYSSLITDIIGRSAGVYALYNKNKLYYVGRATHLKRRVKQHLKDKHQKKWTHFSLYLINYDEHIGELESLLVRISNPHGNAVKPKGKDNRSLRKLEELIKAKHREELKKLLPGSKLANSIKRSKKGTRPESLKGLVAKRTTISRIYLGKEYIAKLTPSGVIIHKNKSYSTPTTAAKAAIRNKKPVNGWYFWKIKNSKGQMVSLKDL